MVILIDNYDSFSYNLFQLIGSINPDIKVFRNDAITVSQIAKMQPGAIVISPGPGRPEDAGICIEVVRRLGGSIPILGVCLGHQSICVAYGAKVSYSKELMHGKQSLVALSSGCALFAGCPETVPAARYHSLAVVEDTLPESLTVAARTLKGELMAVKHEWNEVYGLQFHPESIMTPDGRTMLNNFLAIAKQGG